MVSKDDRGAMISKNTAFYANGVFFQIRGDELILDFHQSSPRYNPETQISSFVREHATIIISAKKLSKIISILNDLQSKTKTPEQGLLMPFK